ASPVRSAARPDRPASGGHFLRAAALPPLPPAFFFCAVVPPCLELEPDPDFFPPRLEAPGLLAMRAARDFDMPFSFSFSYCYSFLTLADLDGISAPRRGPAFLIPRCQLPRIEPDIRPSGLGRWRASSHAAQLRGCRISGHMQQLARSDSPRQRRLTISAWASRWYLRRPATG